MKQINDMLHQDPMRQSDFVDHFFELNSVATTGRWVNTKDTGTLTLGATGDSTVKLTTAATDNNENYLATNTKWDINASRPLVMDCRLQYAEAATNAANIICGFGTYAADTLVDNGAGPLASYSGAWFYKVDGGTKWLVASQVAATNYGLNTTNITAGGSGFVGLRIEIRPISATQCEIVFLYDSTGYGNFNQVRDNTTGALIKHILTYTSYAACPFGFGNKAGSATDETLTVDYARVSNRL